MMLQISCPNGHLCLALRMWTYLVWQGLGAWQRPTSTLTHKLHPSTKKKNQIQISTRRWGYRRNERSLLGQWVMCSSCLNSSYLAETRGIRPFSVTLSIPALLTGWKLIHAPTDLLYAATLSLKMMQMLGALLHNGFKKKWKTKYSVDHFRVFQAAGKHT